jgi:hypothetical protein
MPLLPLLRPAPPDIPSLRDAGDTGGLIGLLSHPDQGVQEQAARALGTLGEPATRHLLAELDHPDTGVRLGVIEALGEIGDAGAVPGLLRILGDGEAGSEVRWAAALALGNLGDPSAVPALVRTLRDPDKYVRFGAAMALRKLGREPAGGEDRAHLLIAEQDWGSLPALGADATHALLRATRDPDPTVRARAVDTLGLLGDARGAEACGLVLRDPDSEVRWRATLAFPRCGVPLMHLPLALVRRPRAGKSPHIAALLNLLFLGLGYSYLDRWYGILLFQLNLTAIVLASLVVGPLIPYTISLGISLPFAVQTWFLAQKTEGAGRE